MSKYNIYAEWTGGYPTLCFGVWNIVVDGIGLTGIGRNNFGTEGVFSSWHFEDWLEVFEDYSEGCSFDLWDRNTNGLSDSLIKHGFDITDDELMKSLYDAISAEDWRSNSCGGCI